MGGQAEGDAEGLEMKVIVGKLEVFQPNEHNAKSPDAADGAHALGPDGGALEPSV